MDEINKSAHDPEKGFSESTDHERIETSLESDLGIIEIGSFGRNAFERKKDQPDRFPFEEIGKTLDKSFLAIPASRHANSFRSGNIILASRNGDDLRVVYLRPNEHGNLEIINAHEVPKDKADRYFEDIGFTGISDQIRTGKTDLEDPQFVRLAYGDDFSLAEQVNRVKERGVDIINDPINFFENKEVEEKQ